MHASAAFRHHTSKKQLTHQLTVNLPSAQGVGLDGIHPSSIDEWPATRRDDMVSTVSRAMRDGNYRFTSYREGLASRGRDRPPRVFAVPTIRDRLVLATMKATFAEVYGFSGPEPPQRKVARVADSVKSGSYSHFLKVDIQDYFASIRHQVLTAKLRQRIRTPALLQLTERALRNSTVAFGERGRGLHSEPDGIQLGLSIASVLAEVYLSDLDDLYSSRGKYFRYVDDILILLRNDRNPFDSVRSDLQLLGLSTHPLPTPGKCEFGTLQQGFDYLGYRFSDTSIGVASGGIRRIESQLASLISRASTIASVPHSKRELARIYWRLNLLIGGCVIDGRARGWIRYHNRMESITVLGHLDALTAALFARYRLAPPGDLKKFRAAYWASRDNQKFRQYAFDLDNTSAADARAHLIEHEAWQRKTVDALTDEQAQATFRRLVRRHVIDLERDLEPAS